MTTNTVDNRFMEFRVGEQLYAIHLLSVREVIQKPEVTQVPNGPADFEGMMNLRGQILGVFNLRKKLNAKPKANSGDGQAVVVVVEEGGVRVGVTVDEVTHVLHPQADAIKPAPLREDDPTKRFVQSVIQSNGELVILLDFEQLLDLGKYRAFLKAA